jgi:hypothetical protein
MRCPEERDVYFDTTDLTQYEAGIVPRASDSQRSGGPVLV